MHQDFLIIGTDAGAGKTYVTCALLKDLRERGMPAMGYKPIACGDRAEARAMRDATEPGISLELINPLYLRATAPPCVAAELQRIAIDPRQLVEGYLRLREAGYGPVIVEGNGGWETVLAPGYTMADFAVELGLPIILVVDNRLGADSLALMTTKGIAARGLHCRGMVLNHPGEEWDTASVTNRKLIEDFTGLPVVAELIQGQEDIDSAVVCGS